MELKDWELRELEKLRRERSENLPELYFEATDMEERAEILSRIKESDAEEEFVKICEELFERRYVSREKNVQKIDYAIRGWVNMKFLPEVARGWFTKKKLDVRVREILNDMGYDVCEKYGALGREIWYKELCNVVRVYIKLCHSDKGYSSIIFGIGKIKKEKLVAKIGEDLVTVTYSIPKEIGMHNEFEQLAQAAKTVFVENYPKEAMFYEQLLDESDMKIKPLNKEK